MAVFEARVFAYFDILGFSEMIKDTKENPKAAEALLSLLKGLEKIVKVQAEIKGKGEFFQDHQSTIFSDTIIFSWPMNTHTIQATIINSITLQSRLLEKNYILRGYISVGEIYHKGNIIFGQPIIDSYLYEKNEVIYPRIVVNPRAIAAMRIEDHTNLDKVLKIEKKVLDEIAFHTAGFDKFWGLQIDDDGLISVDYIAASVKFLHQKEKEFYTSLEKIRKSIIENLEKNIDNSKILSKWLYVANYFNERSEWVGVEPIELPFTLDAVGKRYIT